MKWSIQELRQIASDPLLISEKIDVKADLLERDSEILDISPVQVDGFLVYEDHTVLVQLDLACNVTFTSTRSLSPVIVDNWQLRIRERLIEAGYQTDMIDSDDTIQLPLVNSQTVDLNEMIIQNIVVQKPSQRLTDQEKVTDKLASGQHWNLLTEADKADISLAEADQIDPRLQALQAFFQVDDESSDS